MKKRLILYSILIFIFLLWGMRAIMPREIDDLHPSIPCEQEYIEKSAVLWVIPNFRGIPISENKSWCNQILSLNKTLGLHGINHSYKEFGKLNISENELLEAMKIFENCFGYAPTLFKPPQLSINSQNKQIVKDNLKLKHIFNQLTRRVYHCDNDTTTNEFGGILPNTFYDYI